ncbi:MAG: DUF3443 domain-containing protein [Gallionellaceae bacterium]
MKSNKRPGIRGWALLISVALCMTGCLAGGNSSSNSAPSGSSNSSPNPGQNVLPIIVDAGPDPVDAPSVNVPFVSVTICAPGTSNCQTIDHIIVDTGSTGLRVISSVLSPSLALTQQTAGGNQLAECMRYADGYAWGSIKAADLKLDGESVNSLAIQVIDPSYANIPSSCSNSGPAENTVATFGGNGILGVSGFQQDCGPGCAQTVPPGTYYACAGAACQPVAVALAQQLQNPVGLLGYDNNGVIIDLPAVADTGAATVTGSLILGIGTQSDNSLGNAVVYALDPNYGTLTTTFNRQSYPGSFIDSGSNGTFFPDVATTPVCNSGFYCPASPQQLTATNLGTNGSSGIVSFNVANADSLLSTANTAFSNLAGPTFGTASFDWGLPFHFGRRVYTGIEAGGSGPYVAY